MEIQHTHAYEEASSWSDLRVHGFKEKIKKECGDSVAQVSHEVMF